MLAEIVAAGIRVFSTEDAGQLARFLGEPPATRDRYFDVNVHRARISFSLADLPSAIDHAFTEHGWISW